MLPFIRTFMRGVIVAIERAARTLMPVRFWFALSNFSGFVAEAVEHLHDAHAGEVFAHDAVHAVDGPLHLLEERETALHPQDR